MKQTSSKTVTITKHSLNPMRHAVNLTGTLGCISGLLIRSRLCKEFACNGAYICWKV